MLQTSGPHWTGRRRVVLLLASPLLAAGYAGASGVPVAHLSVAWLALDLLAAALGAAVLASYIPVSGWRPDLGRSPCAAVAALSLLGSTIVIGTYGPVLVGPGIAAAVTLYGLTQGLGPASCARPSPDARMGRLPGR